MRRQETNHSVYRSLIKTTDSDRAEQAFGINQIMISWSMKHWHWTLVLQYCNVRPSAALTFNPSRQRQPAVLFTRHSLPRTHLHLSCSVTGLSALDLSSVYPSFCDKCHRCFENKWQVWIGLLWTTAYSDENRLSTLLEKYNDHNPLDRLEV